MIDKNPTGCLRSTWARAYLGSECIKKGGVISTKMLIPLHGRVGRKRFKAQIAELMRGGNAYFIKNAKGNVVLMAENMKGKTAPWLDSNAGTAKRKASNA